MKKGAHNFKEALQTFCRRVPQNLLGQSWRPKKSYRTLSVSTRQATSTIDMASPNDYDDGKQDFPKVRVLYVISKNNSLNEEYFLAIQNCIVVLQEWYQKQLGGKTFTLHDPIVEVFYSSFEPDYFTNSSIPGLHPDDWYYYNVYNEVHEQYGVKFNDPFNTWIIYCDGPGNKGRGGAGVTVMPEDDLLGLVGRHEQRNPERWIAGGGHELGHAFGLPHPDDIVKHEKAIMWAGFYDPQPLLTSYLTEEDKVILNKSKFFA